MQARSAGLVLPATSTAHSPDAKKVADRPFRGDIVNANVNDHIEAKQHLFDFAQDWGLHPRR